MKKKYCLVALLVLCTLVSLSSCKKTEGGTNPLGAITSFFKKDSKAVESPLPVAAATPKETAPTPEKAVTQPAAPSENVPSKATSALLESSAVEPVSMVPVVEEEPVLVSVLYRGGTYLIHGEFAESEAVLVCRNMNEEEIFTMLEGLSNAYPNIGSIFRCEVVEDELHLAYDKMSENEIRAYWTILVGYLDAYNAEKSEENKTVVTYESAFGAISAEIYPMEARVTIPRETTEEDVSVFLSTLASENPEVIDFCSYTYSDGVIILSFQDPVAEETALYYWDKIVDALLPYGAAPYVMEEPVEAESVKNTEKAPSTVTRVESTPTIAQEEAALSSPVVPVTKAGSFIKEKSYAVTASLGTNIKGDANFSLQGRFEARLTDNISVGVKAGYETRINFPVVVYGKMDLYN
ncbi:MAG: hypothetical protein KBS81_08115, partial [Spirochaetales bacterium]|nr:hypothetical protein [Candidatus Physcosoma equi]